MKQNCPVTAAVINSTEFPRDKRLEVLELTRWIEENPGKFDGVTEKSNRLKKLIMENPNLDPIQNNCKYGFVLPDRCRYTGCDCKPYPSL